MKKKKIVLSKLCTKGQILTVQSICSLTFSQTTNFSLFQSFKFDENGRKLSKGVENTVGNGEIAWYEQFLLFPQCFKRLVSQGHQTVSLCVQEPCAADT